MFQIESVSNPGLKERLDAAISDFNSLSEKKGLKYRLSYVPVHSDIYPDHGFLVLGLPEQLENNAYQCSLTLGADESYNTVQAFIRFVSCEFGE